MDLIGIPCHWPFLKSFSFNDYDELLQPVPLHTCAEANRSDLMLENNIYQYRRNTIEYIVLHHRDEKGARVAR